MNQILLSVTILQFQEQLRFAPVQLIGNNFSCIKVEAAISITDYFSLFVIFPFSTSSFSEELEVVTLFELEILHFRAVDVQHHTSWTCIISVYQSASAVYLCLHSFIRLMFPCSFTNGFPRTIKGENLSKVDFKEFIYFGEKIIKLFGNYGSISLK